MCAILRQMSHNAGASPRLDEKACALNREALMRGSSHFAGLKFKLAAEIWKEEQLPYWRAGTLKSYCVYIHRLNKIFADYPLSEIADITYFREYQKIWLNKIENTCINHDLNTLSQILKKAGLWDKIKPYYKALPIKRWTPPRVMTEEQERRFFEIARSDESWILAYYVAAATNNTSASGIELRSLKLRHVDLSSEPPCIYVPSDSVKNEYRARVIPLNEEAKAIFTALLKRAYSCGCGQPDHYLFPFRLKRGPFDPTRHMSDWTIYKPWHRLVDRAIELGAVNFRVRPHDLRYQVITKLLENGNPESLVMSIAGHVRREMLELYGRHRASVKAEALNGLSKKFSTNGLKFPPKKIVNSA